ncbi:metal-dependent hydrolase [Leptospira kmetyi]|uniref:Metal-dependent hydrolase n=1 Tax=Leptospira kmetyi TaxID=408139 RepID=A0A5F1XWQ9_9LEPT|nr:metal-dependent hydrolase [Leptospira kmetyi]AYV56584.1 metal-dependent hydrolase [Leptospira kmetyi]EQA53070.1 putative metal-dependent hydrolase [Leptospira kmetyi serovar Malaysia str. Bejo-Iso9]PJZ28119.1 metal-dependent hydrolase [Leptospira kmetyi]TGK20276.1 metal-dependent hydrolase [Leptospira kmetyi]TGK34835.1 metal-dependent hydrolase [Leptospira kmetyi]
MNTKNVLEKPDYPVRKPKFQFSETVPKHWCGENASLTHVLNAWTILFPEGEKYFIRTIQKYIPELKEGKVKRNAIAFVGQEAQHAGEHKKFWQNLKDQGYKFEGFMNFVVWFAFGLLEKLFSRKMNMAAVAGLEHYTSLVADLGLRSGLLKQAHPEMRRLFEWHAAEELEHKSAAFDVLQEVTRSYWIRIIGMSIASTIFFAFTFSAVLMFLWQDGLLFRWKTRKELFKLMISEEKVLPLTVIAALKYFRFSFHPDQEDNLYLAKEIFSSQEHQYREAI